ncbi:chymotrypsin inhibitor-like [Ceratina calcarata]|uniref:Chymotrypsin inhibitor-like n=1 Tax=Ceratina calcarata TaxID=156304 RepID=A0AAJ7JCB2_9HYME|nr:chymotrypsin inhibitor-like [Ceratina calcarata]
MSRFAVLALTIIAAVFICQTAGQDHPQCPPNEIWSFCARACEATCANPIECLPLCVEGSPGGCRCRSGYVRNPKNDQCVYQQDC